MRVVSLAALVSLTACGARSDLSDYLPLAIAPDASVVVDAHSSSRPDVTTPPVDAGHADATLDVVTPPADAMPEAVAPARDAGWASFPVDGGPDDDFAAVWGSGPDDVWVVGTVLVHWNGSAWSAPYPVGGGPNPYFFSGVWGSGPSDVWAVGAYDGLAHWDGSAWSASPHPPSGSDFSSVWGTGPSDVWAVGYGGTVASTQHWDGTAWSSFPNGATNLYGAWGSATDDVWAVGDIEEEPDSLSPIIVHWDGSAWSTVLDPVVNSVPSIMAVGGSGAADVWAVGGHTSTASVGNGDMSLHWDGSAWSAVSNDGAGFFLGVWAGTPSDAWSVVQSTGTGGSLAHWDGTAWSTVFMAPGPDGLFGVWGYGANDAWAVGGNGTIVNRP